MPLYSAGNSIIIGGKNHSSSSNPPAFPRKGDSWHELDSQDNYLMSWFYKNNQWISDATGNFTSLFSGVINSNQTHRFSPSFISTSARIYILNMSFGGIIVSPNDSSNYWNIRLDGYYSNSQVYTGLYSFNTQGLTPNFIGRQLLNINDFAPQNVDFFYLNYIRVGNPGAFNGGASVLFRYVR